MKKTVEPQSKTKASMKRHQDLQRIKQNQKLKKDRQLRCIQSSENARRKSASKAKAHKTLDDLKEELRLLKENKKRVSDNRFNLRKAVHCLNNVGYKVLGYSSLKACFEKELVDSKSLPTLYREAEAARLESLLLPTVEIGTVRESVLRPLSKLKDDEKTKKAWDMAMGSKSDKSTYPTAKNVADAVNALIKLKVDEIEMPWNSETENKIAKTVALSLQKQLAKYPTKNIERRIDKMLSLIRATVIQDNAVATVK